ncbi:LOW QUALITY PROTEIN: uncharacterized protein [Macrobrachium rosenbergii]|uniref:LOW QUALITY PROTEIN: uncharacterized protein n=1 Tax=Macrobrachium rosenbergii TaxID=79674 RepID=UPI0034D5EE23
MPIEVMGSIFLDHSSEYDHSIAVFTDGSKSDAGVGFGVVFPDVERSGKLSPIASIFTAKLNSMSKDLKEILPLNVYSFTQYYDSRSALQSSESFNSSHPLILEILVWLLLMETRAIIHSKNERLSSYLRAIDLPQYDPEKLYKQVKHLHDTLQNHPLYYSLLSHDTLQMLVEEVSVLSNDIKNLVNNTYTETLDAQIPPEAIEETLIMHGTSSPAPVVPQARPRPSFYYANDPPVSPGSSSLQTDKVNEVSSNTNSSSPTLSSNLFSAIHTLHNQISMAEPLVHKAGAILQEMLTEKNVNADTAINLLPALLPMVHEGDASSSSPSTSLLTPPQPPPSSSLTLSPLSSSSGQSHISGVSNTEKQTHQPISTSAVDFISSSNKSVHSSSSAITSTLQMTELLLLNKSESLQHSTLMQSSTSTIPPASAFHSNAIALETVIHNTTSTVTVTHYLTTTTSKYTSSLSNNYPITSINMAVPTSSATSYSSPVTSSETFDNLHPDNLTENFANLYHDADLTGNFISQMLTSWTTSSGYVGEDTEDSPHSNSSLQSSYISTHEQQSTTENTSTVPDLLETTNENVSTLLSNISPASAKNISLPNDHVSQDHPVKYSETPQVTPAIHLSSSIRRDPSNNKDNPGSNTVTSVSDNTNYTDFKISSFSPHTSHYFTITLVNNIFLSTVVNETPFQTVLTKNQEVAVPLPDTKLPVRSTNFPGGSEPQEYTTMTAMYGKPPITQVVLKFPVNSTNMIHTTAVEPNSTLSHKGSYESMSRDIISQLVTTKPTVADVDKSILTLPSTPFSSTSTSLSRKVKPDVQNSQVNTFSAETPIVSTTNSYHVPTESLAFTSKEDLLSPLTTGSVHGKIHASFAVTGNSPVASSITIPELINNENQSFSSINKIHDSPTKNVNTVHTEPEPLQGQFQHTTNTAQIPTVFHDKPTENLSFKAASTVTTNIVTLSLPVHVIIISTVILPPATTLTAPLAVFSYHSLEGSVITATQVPSVVGTQFTADMTLNPFTTSFLHGSFVDPQIILNQTHNVWTTELSFTASTKIPITASKAQNFSVAEFSATKFLTPQIISDLIQKVIEVKSPDTDGDLLTHQTQSFFVDASSTTSSSVVHYSSKRTTDQFSTVHSITKSVGHHFNVSTSQTLEFTSSLESNIVGPKVPSTSVYSNIQTSVTLSSAAPIATMSYVISLITENPTPHITSYFLHNSEITTSQNLTIITQSVTKTTTVTRYSTKTPSYISNEYSLQQSNVSPIYLDNTDNQVQISLTGNIKQTPLVLSSHKNNFIQNQWINFQDLWHSPSLASSAVPNSENVNISAEIPHTLENNISVYLPKNNLSMPSTDYFSPSLHSSSLDGSSIQNTERPNKPTKDQNSPVNNIKENISVSDQTIPSNDPELTSWNIHKIQISMLNDSTSNPLTTQNIPLNNEDGVSLVPNQKPTSNTAAVSSSTQHSPALWASHVNGYDQVSFDTLPVQDLSTSTHHTSFQNNISFLEPQTSSNHNHSNKPEKESLEAASPSLSINETTPDLLNKYQYAPQNIKAFNQNTVNSSLQSYFHHAGSNNSKHNLLKTQTDRKPGYNVTHQLPSDKKETSSEILTASPHKHTNIHLHNPLTVDISDLFSSSSGPLTLSSLIISYLSSSLENKTENNHSNLHKQPSPQKSSQPLHQQSNGLQFPVMSRPEIPLDSPTLATQSQYPVVHIINPNPDGTLPPLPLSFNRSQPPTSYDNMSEHKTVQEESVSEKGDEEFLNLMKQSLNLVSPIMPWMQSDKNEPFSIAEYVDRWVSSAFPEKSYSRMLSETAGPAPDTSNSDNRARISADNAKDGGRVEKKEELLLLPELQALLHDSITVFNDNRGFTPHSYESLYRRPRFTVSATSTTEPKTLLPQSGDSITKPATLTSKLITHQRTSPPQIFDRLSLLFAEGSTTQPPITTTTLKEDLSAEQLHNALLLLSHLQDIFNNQQQANVQRPLSASPSLFQQPSQPGIQVSVIHNTPNHNSDFDVSVPGQPFGPPLPVASQPNAEFQGYRPGYHPSYGTNQGYPRNPPVANQFFNNPYPQYPYPYPYHIPQFLCQGGGASTSTSTGPGSASAAAAAGGGCGGGSTSTSTSVGQSAGAAPGTVSVGTNTQGSDRVTLSTSPGSGQAPVVRPPAIPERDVSNADSPSTTRSPPFSIRFGSRSTTTTPAPSVENDNYVRVLTALNTLMQYLNATRQQQQPQQQQQQIQGRLLINKTNYE